MTIDRSNAEDPNLNESRAVFGEAAMPILPAIQTKREHT